MQDSICELQDMRHLDWATRKMSPGTLGCFLKAYEEVNGKRLYYKLSNYDSYRGVFGHECVNELLLLMVKNKKHGFLFQKIFVRTMKKSWRMICIMICKKKVMNLR